MSWIKSRLKEILLIFLLTTLLILVVELMMYSIYLATGSKYFANSDQLNVPIDCPNSLSLEGNQIKVAIFGGSSAGGYASPISFTKILCNYNSKNNNLVITNFAKNAAPFSDFQSEIIKEVMIDYDIIVLYAGHNEFWSQAFRRGNKTLFPNGIEVADPKKVNSIHSKGLAALRIKLSKAEKIQNFIIEKSRVFFFLQRVIIKFNMLFNESAVLNSEVYPRDFYYEDIFLTELERKNILELYKKNIEEISNKLNSKQKLIISTVMSNDLFPPIADVYMHSEEQKDLDSINRQLKNIYSQLSSKNIRDLRDAIEALPESAHRLYLEGLLCLELSDKFIQKSDNNMCFSILTEARRNDAMPLRVVPEINSFIRSFRHENVVIIDPVRDMMEIEDSLYAYKDFFIDFQHPSNLGHTIIAKSILSKIYPNEAMLDSFNLELCGISLEGNGVQENILSSYDECVGAFNQNLHWLTSMIEIQPVSFQYDYYKTIVESNLKNIFDGSNP
jgi:hypothetical protein